MIYKYILLFFIYSFIGWIMEVICYLIEHRKLVNRGFFLGPYCPIYGCGGLLIVFLLNSYVDDVIVLFIMTIVICSILEYFTSYLMEKLFQARWWDYSKYKFNLNGRICLETMIPFGVIGCLVTYIINPFFSAMINGLPPLLVQLLSIFLLILFIIDNIVSFKIISNLKLVSLNIRKDNTEEITKKVKETLTKKNSFTRRLVDAFPDFTIIKEMTLKKLSFKKKELRKKQREVKKIEHEISRSEKKLMRKWQEGSMGIIVGLSLLVIVFIAIAFVIFSMESGDDSK